MYTFGFTIFFLLSCASAASLGRRHLYDDAVLPPPLTPTSPSFFPLNTFAPPPLLLPPATFPANISALVLPRSPKPHPASPTLVIPALSAVLVIATGVGVALFLYGRWRGQKRHFKDASHDEPRRNITNNLSVAATTSTSEVFYLRPEESDRIRSAEPVTSFVKPESPEICPLPPLLPLSFQHCYEDDFLSEGDDEEDEFYSPLVSLAASESSSPSHSGSCSSRWVSPARSFSITMSPRSNPRYSDASSVQNLQSPSPERLRVRKGSSLRMFSFWNQNVGFPRISSASTSPDRGTITTPDAYAPSSVSTSPDGFFRKFIDSSPPIWNDFSRNVKSVLLSSDSASSRRDFVINIGESFSAILNPDFGRRQQSEAAAAPLPPPTRPPPLVPPSLPFVVQKPSFTELRDGSCQKIAWDRLRSSSFKLNKEMVETLFIANSSIPNIKQRGALNYDFPILNQSSQVSDPRKAENIATLLRLLNLTTTDVCQALLHGDCDALGAELLECLSRLAPAEEEEKKLKSYGDESTERFLKQLCHVPFVFKRIHALNYVANFHSETEYLRGLFGVVQAACKELRSSRMFWILVEVIFKTGNKMNVGTNGCDGSHSFKLDTLLKLVEAKGLDGRSSLLHFAVQEVIKSQRASLNGIRSLSSELENVKRSAEIEYGVLSSHVLKVYQGIKTIKELLLLSEESGSNGDQWLKFREVMVRFLETAEGEIVMIGMQESSTLSALEEVTEQFLGESAKEGHTLRVFRVVRDFLSILDKVCNQMGY